MNLLVLLIPVVLVSFALYAVLEPANWKIHLLFTFGYVFVAGVVSLVSAVIAGARSGAFELGDINYTFTTITVCMIVGLGGYSLFREYL
ncbi:hypothetical protein [Marinococcus luteus]|uniref:hypothetical protein n=1 Tax=Marinococcus luteus TaxID=1122204 RepID=UPI002ACD0257|nr:hypothetical protein [Marinococcus luteus]MDZ5782003.1 hypothetical protein [Marinococcus luteus]